MTFTLSPWHPGRDEDNDWEWDTPRPGDPTWVAQQISDRLGGEEIGDWGLYWVVEGSGDTLAVYVMTEDAEGHEITLASYRVAVTPITPA